jgi:hypothetical protein
MKRIYEKPALTKSKVTLQAVTAKSGITGPGNGGIDVGEPAFE